MAGLFHKAEHLALARDQREREPVAGALRLLASPTEQTADALPAAYLAALRYQFYGDDAAAESAFQQFAKADLSSRPAVNQARCKTLLAWLSVAALLRQHERWQALCSRLKPACIALATGMPVPLNASPDPLEELWQGALRLATGIVFAHEPCQRLGQAAYRKAVDQVIHPEGFLKGIVDGERAEATYARQVSGACALVIMAEMATLAGSDLWSYENRGVTPVTATTYLLYYYYYPEKWRWNEDLSPEAAAAAINCEGAFIEIVQRRHALRGVELLLAERRPLFCASGGGLTTLTHAVAPPKKRRWPLL